MVPESSSYNAHDFHRYQASSSTAKCLYYSLPLAVPTDSPLHGGDVEVYVFDINQPSLPTPF